MTGDSLIVLAGFGLLLLVLAALIWNALATGEVSSRYGTSVKRREAPRRFWAYIVMMSLLACVPAGFMLLFVVSPRR